MNIHISKKFVTTLIMFAAAFILVMLLFIKKPHIVKSKNKYIRAIMVFSLAFVPGVLAASVCAKTIVTLYERVFASPAQIVCEAEEKEENEELRYRETKDE